MSDLDVLGVFAQVAPQGPSRADDASMLTTAPVYGVDAAARLVQVGVHGTALWLPAMPGRYRPTSLSPARVLLNPTTARPEVVLGPIDPWPPVVPGTLTAINTTTKIATVSVHGASHQVPYMPSTYTVGAAVWVGLDDWGLPLVVHSPSDVAASGGGSPEPPPSRPDTVRASTTIGPTWSGSYRHIRGAWDRWNVDRYGGRSTLYQGNGYGSGPMSGLAVYGDQVVNLGATTIHSIDVALRPVGLASGSPPVTVQGSPQGTPPGGSPVATGDTATGMSAWVALPASIREGMRTGAIKGLATVGGAYSAVAGAGNGDGMVLRVNYSRPA